MRLQSLAVYLNEVYLLPITNLSFSVNKTQDVMHFSQDWSENHRSTGKSRTLVIR